MNGQWNEVGRTERIKNNNSPRFSKSFTVTYYFERTQHMRFSVYDADSKDTSETARHDLVGHVETTMANIMSAPSGTFVQPIVNETRGKGLGNIVIKGEEVSGANFDVV